MTPTLAGQLYRDVLGKVRREFGREIVVPWMKAKELDIILEILARLRPARCLEWGAGISTLYFPSRTPGLTRWLSVEHQREWYEQVARRNQDARVEVVHIPPDQGDYLTTRQEGTLEDFRTYIGYPETLGERFDFILVDGRARRFCLQAASRLVTDRGVVVLHDANRAAYFEDPPAFPHEELFTDWKRRAGGVWAGSKGRPIGEVLDVPAHRRLWAGHNAVANVLFLKRAHS